jgi:hypothetical protein
VARRHDVQSGAHRHAQVHTLGECSREGVEELYDLDRDPYELMNLAKQPEYRPVRQQLQRELRRLATKALGL